MRTIIAIIMTLFAVNAMAEERELLLSGEMEFGGFGGPVISSGEIAGRGKTLLGGQGALLINHAFYIGGAGGGTASDIGAGFSSFSYGGLFVGSFIRPQRALHYYAQLGIYAGNLSKDNQTATWTDDSAENFTILEPEFGIGLNLMRHSKVTIGVSQRKVSSLDSIEITASQLEDTAIHLRVLFGAF